MTLTITLFRLNFSAGKLSFSYDALVQKPRYKSDIKKEQILYRLRLTFVSTL